MPLHTVPRYELHQFVEATEEKGTKIVSISPDFAEPGSFIVVTAPVAERDLEVRS